MGAASGLLATLAFLGAFVVFLSTGPTGDPPFPSVQNAQAAPVYIAANLNAYPDPAAPHEPRDRALPLVPQQPLGEPRERRGRRRPWLDRRGGRCGRCVGADARRPRPGRSRPGSRPARRRRTWFRRSSPPGSLLFAIGGASMSLFFFGVARVDASHRRAGPVAGRARVHLRDPAACLPSSPPSPRRGSSIRPPGSRPVGVVRRLRRLGVPGQRDDDREGASHAARARDASAAAGTEAAGEEGAGR